MIRSKDLKWYLKEVFKNEECLKLWKTFLLHFDITHPELLPFIKQEIDKESEKLFNSKIYKEFKVVDKSTPKRYVYMTKVLNERGELNDFCFYDVPVHILCSLLELFILTKIPLGKDYLDVLRVELEEEKAKRKKK